MSRQAYRPSPPPPSCPALAPCRSAIRFLHPARPAEHHDSNSIRLQDCTNADASGRRRSVSSSQLCLRCIAECPSHSLQTHLRRRSFSPGKSGRRDGVEACADRPAAASAGGGGPVLVPGPRSPAVPSGDSGERGNAFGLLLVVTGNGIVLSGHCEV